MRRTVLLSMVVACVLVASTAGAAVSPTPVIATGLDEQQPVASADYIAWAQNSSAHPKHYDLYVQPVGGESFRVNAAGTEGGAGGIDGTTLVYQEYRYKQAISDVKLFDLAAETASDPPTGVNTDQWEYSPRLSGDWLLFGRHNVRSGNDDIVLFDLATGEAQTLAHTRGWNRELDAGQVNGDFAVWVKTVWKHDVVVSGEVFVYDIAAGTTTQIPNPNDRWQYGPSVTGTGTVYFGQSRWGCGLSVKLMSYPLGGPAATLVKLPRGTDLYGSYALTKADGSTSVFYDPVGCGGQADADIYEVDVP